MANRVPDLSVDHPLSVRNAWLAGVFERLLRGWKRLSASQKHAISIAVSLGIVLVFFALILCTKRYIPIAGFDEGILLVYPEQVLRGAVPNLDFFSVYPPGNFWNIATAYKLFGASIGTERMVGVLYRLVLVLAIYGCTLHRGYWIAAGCALLTAIATTYSGMMAFAWMGAMALCVSSIYLLSLAHRTADWKNSMLLFMSGLLAGYTAAMRIDMPAVGVVIASLPLLVLLGQWKPRLIYAGGWVAGILPLLWHVLRAGAGQFFENVLIEPIYRVGPARRIPFPPADPQITLLLITAVACALLVIGVAVWRLWLKRDREGWIYASLAIFTLCILPQALQRADGVHAMYVAQISWGLAPIAVSMLLEWCSKLPAGNGWIQIISASLVGNFVLLVGHSAVPNFSALLPSSKSSPANRHYWLTNQGRTVPVANDGEATLYGAVLSHVNTITQPGDTLFVGSGDLRYTGLNDVYFYFLLPQLVPSGYHLELNPGSANRDDSSLPRDVGNAKVLILNSVHSAPGENLGNAGSDAANQVVISKFISIGNAGPVTVYVRKQ